MELTHDFVVPAPVDAAWETFMDLERVGGCFPGATVTEATGDAFAGAVKVKLGPIALQYTGAGRFIERDDTNHRAVIEAKGKDKRGNGTAGATVTVQLAPADGGSHTRVDVTTELSITGKPAQFGRGVMQDVSDKLLQQFVQCIEGQFADAAPASAASSATVAAGAAGAPEATPPPADAFGDTSPDDVAVPVVAQESAPVESAHGEPLAQYRAEVADGEGMALAPEPATRHTVSRPAPPRQAAADDSIDLGATVLPVLIKSYAPHAVGALVAIALGYVLGRRSRR